MKIQTRSHAAPRAAAAAVAFLIAGWLAAPQTAHAWAGRGNGSAPVTVIGRPVPISSGGASLTDASDVDGNLRRLAGLGPAGAPTAGWPCSDGALANFSARNLSEANSRTRRVIYPFGGVDFLYPDVLFPNLDHIVLVAMQPVGRVATAGSVSPARVQGAFRALRGCGTSSTYGITKDMAAEQAGLGTSTLVAVAVAARGHHVDAVEAVSLDRSGAIVAGGAGSPGVRVSYTKASGGRGEAIYIQQAVSDAVDASGLGALVRGGSYDVGFYKASMYIPHHQSAANALVANSVRYLVMPDDGIPIAQLGGGWDIRLFGTYAAPSGMFGVGPQPALYNAYASAICDSRLGERALGLRALSGEWGRALNDQTCGQIQRGSATWGGMLLDFPYSYSAASGPAGYKRESSNLIYAIRR